MPDLWSDLLACLDVHPVPSGGTGEERAGDDVTEFEGRNQQLDYHRVFGGQLLGQFPRIACLSCPDKDVKSQHTVFTREGRADEPIRYQATRQHEGRSFANVTITARQSRGVGGYLVDLHARTRRRSRASVGRRGARRPRPRASPQPRPDPMGDPRGRRPQRHHHRPAAVRGLDAFTSAVTSHTIWFHRPFRTDGWLLLRQHSPLLAHGRSFGRGDMLTKTARSSPPTAQEAPYDSRAEDLYASNPVVSQTY